MSREFFFHLWTGGGVVCLFYSSGLGSILLFVTFTTVEENFGLAVKSK